jgi:hypothetical protein
MDRQFAVMNPTPQTFAHGYVAPYSLAERQQQLMEQQRLVQLNSYLNQQRMQQPSAQQEMIHQLMVIFLVIFVINILL